MSIKKKVKANLLGHKERKSAHKAEDNSNDFDLDQFRTQSLEAFTPLNDGLYYAQVEGFKVQHNKETPGVNISMKLFDEEAKKWVGFEPFILFKTTEGMEKANFEWQDSVIQFMDWLGLQTDIMGQERLDFFLEAWKTEAGLDIVLKELIEEQHQAGVILLPLYVQGKFPRWSKSIRPANQMRDSENFEETVAEYMTL